VSWTARTRRAGWCLVNRLWSALAAWWISTEYDVVCVPLERWHAMHSEIDRLRHENALLRQLNGEIL
jgi:hypothetical protein